MKRFLLKYTYRMMVFSLLFAGSTMILSSCGGSSGVHSSIYGKKKKKTPVTRSKGKMGNWEGDY